MAASAAETVATASAKLNLGEDTDGNGNPFASDVEADVEEDETV